MPPWVVCRMPNVVVVTNPRHWTPPCAADCLGYVEHPTYGTRASSRESPWTHVHVRIPLDFRGKRSYCHSIICLPCPVNNTNRNAISRIETRTPRLLVRAQTTQRAHADAALAATCSAPVTTHLTKAPRRCTARRRRNPRRRVRQRGLSK